VAFAGHETSATTLAWCLSYMAQPAMAATQQQLHEELCEVCARDAVPLYSDVGALPLLDAVVNETLRIVPAASGFVRVAVKDDTLPSGLRVRAGEEITISTQTIHTAPYVWGEDALDFKPQRWFSERVRDMVANTEKHGLVFFPFSAGNRDCIGRSVAVTELKLVLAALFRSFRITLSPANQPPVLRRLAFTTRLSYTPMLRFEPRDE
jgi:cytochrome P450